MSSELLLILLVAIIVFGPDKLPMLARHLGKLTSKITLITQQFQQIWTTFLAEEQLRENERKAKVADEIYECSSQDRLKFQKLSD